MTGDEKLKGISVSLFEELQLPSRKRGKALKWANDEGIFERGEGRRSKMEGLSPPY